MGHSRSHDETKFLANGTLPRPRYHIPGPATLDGVIGPWNKQKSNKSCSLVIEMLEHMKLHPSIGGPEVMEMERFWHPKMNRYGRLE